MQTTNSYILWLPSWYPNRLEPYNGDFIQRHAKAAALYQNIQVIFVVRDAEGIVTKDVYVETAVTGQLSETIIYYYVPGRKLKFLEKLFSYRTYSSVYKSAIRNCIQKKGYPALVHLYIAFKAGLIARWVKKQFGIPYAVSEQWTLYLPEAKPGFSEQPSYTRLLFKRIFKGSESVMVVSNYLAQQITRLFGVTNLIVIPNVVDQAMFRYSEKAEAVQNRFVHISTLTFQKNPEGMLQAFSLVKQQGYAFKLDIIGPSCPPLEQAAIELDLQDYVEFHKEMPQRELVSFVQNADALVLFSRYETFGCVLIEANACGVPVIVSDHPVLQENVRSGENGLFARNEDPADLAAQIIHIISNGHTFNKAKIAQTAAEQFSYRRVGAQLNAWYSKHKKADVGSDKLQDDHEKF